MMSQRRRLDRLRYVIKMTKLQAKSSVGLFTDSTLAPPTQPGTKPATECYILRGPYRVPSPERRIIG
jgi:hypothetical protein